MKTVYAMPDGNIFYNQADLIKYYDINLVESPGVHPIPYVTRAALEIVTNWGCTVEDLKDGDFTDDERLMIKIAYGESLSPEEREVWNTMMEKMEGCIPVDDDDNVIGEDTAVEIRYNNTASIFVAIGIVLAIVMFILGFVKHYEEKDSFICEYPVVETELDLRQGKRVTGALLSSEDNFIYNKAGYPIFYYTGIEYWMWGYTRLVDIPEEYAKNHILSRELFDQYFYFNDKWELMVEGESLAHEEGTCYCRQAEFGVNDFYVVYPIRLSTTDELYGFVIYPED